HGFFFQADDGIRDRNVTGVQTCALPISLLHTSGLDLIGHLQHRGVDGVDRDPADLLVTGLVLDGGDVTAATLDGQLDLELALVVDRGDVQVGVVHLDAGRRGDVGGGDRAGALLAQVHHDRFVVLRGDDHVLQVQDDLGDVFLHTGNGRELVQDAVDADAGHCGARNGRQQRPAQ